MSRVMSFKKAIHKLSYFFTFVALRVVDNLSIAGNEQLKLSSFNFDFEQYKS